MMAEFRATPGQPGQPGPPGPPGPPGQPGEPGEANGAGVMPRFLSSDVGFFDPFYDGKSNDTGAGIEHAGKETYFRDVTMFIDRIRDVARVKGAELLRNNLQICLRGEALEWYTCQLTDNEKRLMTYGNHVDEWNTALLERFGPTKALGMATIVKERYSHSDAIRHREPREYAMTIIRAAKIAKLGDVHNQLDIIWNGLDVEFQSDIDPPTIQTTLNQFLTAMDIRKNQWWTKASRMTKHNPNNPSQQKRTNNCGYQSRQPQPQPQNNAYQNNQQQQSRPWRPTYGGGYQNNQPRPQVYQNNQGNARVSLPAPPTRLQITAPPGGSGSDSKPSDCRPWPDRQPFRPSTGNYQGQGRFQPRPQRAYHQEAVEENTENEPEPDQDAYTNHAPDQYEETSAQDYNDYDHQEQGEYQDDVVDGFFSVTTPTRDYRCERCQHKTTSRKKLFTHLREECWTRPTKDLVTDVSKQDSEIVDALTADPESSAELLIIASVSEPVPGTGYAFRSYHYAVTHISWKPAGEKKEACADAGFVFALARFRICGGPEAGREVKGVRALGNVPHLSDVPVRSHVDTVRR